VQNAFVVRRGPVFTEIPKGASVVDVLEAGRRADFEAADKAALLARADLYETVLLDHPTYASSIRALVNERPMEIG
jgi:hypothetical protein